MAINFRQNVLILSSQGGGCHDAVAKAVQMFLGDRYSCHTIYPLRQLSVSRYFLDAEKVYNFLFRSGYLKVINQIAVPASSWFARREEPAVNRLVEDSIEELKPIFVISVAPIFNRSAMQICVERGIPYCLITLDANLTTWVAGLESVAHLSDRVFFTIICDALETRGLLEQSGILPESIHTIGFPIRSEFFETREEKRVICERLAVPFGRKVVLIMGGGVGAGYVSQIAEVLVKACLGVDFVVIAGNNASLKRSIEKLTVDSSNTLTVVGFTSEIANYMQIANLLITKSGPGTLSEAAEIYRNNGDGTPFVLVKETDALFWERPNIARIKEVGFGDSFQEGDVLKKVEYYLENPPPLVQVEENRFWEGMSEIFQKMILTDKV